MKLIGSYKLSVKKEIVWQALNNPDILKQCIPGCESFVKESSTVFSASATNQIGPMNATFSGKVSLSNIKENESYTITGEGQSAVGFANGNADVKLVEENGFTVLKVLLLLFSASPFPDTIHFWKKMMKWYIYFFKFFKISKKNIFEKKNLQNFFGQK